MCVCVCTCVRACVRVCECVSLSHSLHPLSAPLSIHFVKHSEHVHCAVQVDIDTVIAYVTQLCVCVCVCVCECVCVRVCVCVCVDSVCMICSLPPLVSFLTENRHCFQRLLAAMQTYTTNIPDRFNGRDEVQDHYDNNTIHCMYSRILRKY